MPPPPLVEIGLSVINENNNVMIPSYKEKERRPNKNYETSRGVLN